MSTIEPPGARTRTSSCSARRMSLEWWMTPHENTSSNLPSGSSRRSQSPSATSAVSPNTARRLRVVSTAHGVRSRAVVSAPASANSWTAKPLPHPTSSTLLPRKPAKSTKRENGRPSAPTVRRSTLGSKTRLSSSRNHSCVSGAAAIGSPTSYDIGFRFHQSRTAVWVMAALPSLGRAPASRRRAAPAPASRR